MVLGRVVPTRSLEGHHGKSGDGETSTSQSDKREEDPAGGEAHGRRDSDGGARVAETNCEEGCQADRLREEEEVGSSKGKRHCDVGMDSSSAAAAAAAAAAGDDEGEYEHDGGGGDEGEDDEEDAAATAGDDEGEDEHDGGGDEGEDDEEDEEEEEEEEESEDEEDEEDDESESGEVFKSFSKKRSASEKDGEAAEEVPSKVSLEGLEFVRLPNPDQPGTFKYRITQGPAEHVGKTYVTKAGLAKLYSNHSRGRTDLSVFAFVNSGGPKIKRSKRSRGVAVMLGNNDIASISVDSADKHPLACCARIVLEFADMEMAAGFMRPVVELVNKATADEYSKVVQRPMDLGTILTKLRTGFYVTAYEVRKDVSTVWSNCQLYNAPGDAIYRFADELKEKFDKRFAELVQAPEHNGMKEFPGGDMWTGIQVDVYESGASAWLPGVVSGYNAETRSYTIKMEEGREIEYELPHLSVVVTGDWSQLAQQLEPWAGMSDARHNRGTRTRQPPATLDPTHESGRHMQRSAGADRKVANSHQNGSNQHSHSAGQDKTKSHRPATDEVVGPAIGWYSCQDGVFSEVCCCRALLWCRFRTRKGLFDQNHDIRYPKGMPTDECGYSLCPNREVSTPEQTWHVINQYTRAGDWDWTALRGKVLCDECFSHYRKFGTLVRAATDSAL